MSKNPRDPAPVKVPVVDYATPDITDVIFYVHVNSNTRDYSDPAYGTLFNGYEKDDYPNHKLVYVSNADASGWKKHFYAADRSNQGDYNFKYVQPSGSSSGYPFYTRVYVELREDVDKYLGPYLLDPIFGDDLVVDFLSFSGEPFTEGVAQEGKPTYDAVDGSQIYWSSLSEDRWYIQINGGELYYADSSADTPVGISTWIKYSEPSEFEPAVISHNVLSGEYPAGEYHLEAGDPDPDIAFNPEFSGFEFSGMKILRVQDKELDSIYVLIERKFEKFCTLSGSKLNKTTGECEPYSIEILPNDDPNLSCSPVDPVTGVGSEVTPLNCDYSRKVTGVMKPFSSRVYTTYINYGWPAVLDYVEIMEWTLKAGGARYYPRVVYKRNSYNGPTKAEITQSWYKDPPTPNTAYAMLPTAIQYSCPFYSVNTGPCLHECTSFICDILDTSDPKWDQNTGSERTTPPTNYTDWPESIVVSSKVSPASYGYIHTEVKIFKPTPSPENDYYSPDYETWLENFDSSKTCGNNNPPIIPPEP